jgi:hypothetical protein
MFDAKISPPPRAETAERSNRGGHLFCRRRGLECFPDCRRNQTPGSWISVGVGNLAGWMRDAQHPDFFRTSDDGSMDRAGVESARLLLSRSALPDEIDSLFVNLNGAVAAFRAQSIRRRPMSTFLRYVNIPQNSANMVRGGNTLMCQNKCPEINFGVYIAPPPPPARSTT